MSKTSPVLDMRTCLIVDATYSPHVAEDLDSDIEETPFSEYGNTVVLLLQDIETYNTYHCPLSASSVAELAKLSEEPTPRQMIKFAAALRQRDKPVALLVATDSDLVTPDMIEKLQKKGLLQTEEAMKKYEAAKARQNELMEEQKSVPQSEYEQFMAEQDEQLQNKFAQWSLEKEEASRKSAFIDLDNIEDEEE